MNISYYTIDDLRLPPKRSLRKGRSVEQYSTLEEALARYQSLPAAGIRVLGLTDGIHVLELVKCLPLFPDDQEGENVLALDYSCFPLWAQEPEAANATHICITAMNLRYVALCGTSEHAMLWMLEKDPRLQKVVLCLDHDAAGIEATGRLTDILGEHGYTQVSILRPEYKDWDEDLKALNGQLAQPAEQHPQLQAAEFVCARIAVKCVDLKPDRAEQRVPALFQFYRRCLQEKKLDTAMDCAEEMAALSLLVTLRECRQLGIALTPTQGSQYLQSHILPHQNRMAIRNRTEEIAAQLQTALDKSNAPGVRGETEKREIAGTWLELALSCAKVSVKYDAEELRLMEKQKQSLEMEMG